MTSFSSTHHAGKGFMYVNKDIFPHHQPMTVEKRGHLTPTKQIQQFKYTFREQLYSDPHYNPTSLAFTEKEVKRRATLTGKKLPEFTEFKNIHVGLNMVSIWRLKIKQQGTTR